MKMSDFEENGRDWDWFCVGLNGEIIHFASGGGRLPKAVKKSVEDLEFLSYYFLTLPIKNPNQNFNLFGMNAYAEMAKRGLFSYDNSYVDADGLHYKKIYHPVEKLYIHELHEEIQEILKDIRMPIDPNRQDEIDFRAFVERFD
jgi:hypothetical protein